MKIATLACPASNWPTVMNQDMLMLLHVSNFSQIFRNIDDVTSARYIGDEVGLIACVDLLAQITNMSFNRV